jgi:uncharacterized lipoprotein YddW (UPF0748 family)
VRLLPGVLLAALAAAPVAAQPAAPPKQEVRAVWISTAAGLDWPRTRDPKEQQRSLRAMVASVHAARMNTIYFQVRARGDAYYRSSFEPWAENLTGTLGKDPGWDPLQFLLDEAHAAGIEVHAWFNVYKVRGPGRPGASSPQHPARAHPDWVITYENEGWLNPGIPDVNPYLLSVALDLLHSYDVDGMHFDFLRYPGRDFPDDETYRRDGRGMDRDDWRRSNINRFVSAFYDTAVVLRPLLKIGSAPIGIYKGGNGRNGWGAYANYFQDSQGWLRDGNQDYLAPQIYWDIGESPGDPDFSALARSWTENAAGRQMIAGIAAYKPAVLAQIPEQIDVSRSLGMSGQAYFRYEFVRDPAVFGGRYATWANVPPMPWKDAVPPNAPAALAVTETSPGVFTLEWTPPLPAADGERARLFNVYRWTDASIPFQDPRAIVAVVPGERTFIADTVGVPMGAQFFYAVSALDRTGNESTPTTTSASMRELVALSSRLPSMTGLAATPRDETLRSPLVAFALATGGEVLLELRTGRPVDSTRAVLARGRHPAGTYVVGIPPGLVSPGRYVLRLTAGASRLEQPLDVP